LYLATFLGFKFSTNIAASCTLVISQERAKNKSSKRKLCSPLEPSHEILLEYLFHKSSSRSVWAGCKVGCIEPVNEDAKVSKFSV